MIAAWNDWDKGHTPVTTGRVPWLPGKFLDAVHAVRAAVNDCNAEVTRKLHKGRRG